MGADGTTLAIEDELVWLRLVNYEAGLLVGICRSLSEMTSGEPKGPYDPSTHSTLTYRHLNPTINYIILTLAKQGCFIFSH